LTFVYTLTHDEKSSIIDRFFDTYHLMTIRRAYRPTFLVPV